MDFWVQIHSIPLLCMTQEIGAFLRRMIGEVREVEIRSATEGSCRYLRVKATVDTGQPLQRCLRVDLLGNGKVTTMLLRYERLHDYCFRCVRIGHNMDECVEDGDDKDMSSDANRRLGTWLRATSPLKRSFKGGGRVDNRDWGRKKGLGGFKSTNGNERCTHEN
ncbi:hypothetical protein Dsin_017920 [Dipteronia sinensis]|uniref:Zinc knuckle CX2CX4HX4C domain-containing protein n=1 Tax=Dipteronia sinensis TaxID=43782 RepID=A0AAE0E701_9ROSI|nr:hypothetical protein Dsin_017920 [Dipteronia sinensis]